MNRTNVYIDGFNLYYGAIRGTRYHWLDLAELCRRLLPGHKIHRIRYYTARVKARPNDPGQAVRQQMYLRALRTIPNLSIHYGHFLSHPTEMPLAGPPGTPSVRVRVIKTEEKGSDVNLATHLIHDGHQDDFDVAVVISNDSDLLEPIRIVRRELEKPVGVISPHKSPSVVLRKEATFVKTIRKGALAGSQFPHTLTDANGTFRSPPDWQPGTGS